MYGTGEEHVGLCLTIVNTYYGEDGIEGMLGVGT
jgi:hypothetical protein